MDNLQTYTARQERKKYEKEAFDEKPSVKLCNGSVHGSVTGCLRSQQKRQLQQRQRRLPQQRLKLLQRVRQQRQREKPPQRPKAKAVTSKTW